MGCCPSKRPALGKEYAVNATEVAPILPSAVSADQVEPILDDAVDEMFMDRGDRSRMDKSDDEEPTPEEEEFKIPSEKVEGVLDEVLIRNPERVTALQSPPSPPWKTADDIPISSTYHRVHSAEVAEQEAKRQEELRLEAEHREQEVRDYK
ncbi:hypothetical protein V7S43_007869, partial [Phytophthora oleae]